MKEFPTMYLPCGGQAEFDDGTGCSYRCWTCMATVGSIGQSQSCKEEAKKWETYEKLGMWRWDYDKGEPYAVCIDNKKNKR